MTEQATETTDQPGSSESYASPDAPSTDAQPGLATAAAEATPTPDIPEAYRTENGTADMEKLLARVAEADKPVEGLPESADGYDVSLPDDLGLPEGVDFKIDANNEHLKEALGVLHEARVPQGVVSKLLPSYVKALAGDMASIKSASDEQIQAEVAKLGDNPVERVQGLTKSVAQVLEKDEAGAAAIVDGIHSVAAFEAIETLISKLNGGDETVRTDGGASDSNTKPREDRMYG